MTKLETLTLNQTGITDFAAARNKLLHSAKSDWILFLDSDEQLSVPVNPTQLDKHFNYSFKRQDWFLGKKLRFGETASVRLVRLVQPQTGYWQGRVHEKFISRLPVRLLPQPILHRRCLHISDFLDRLNYYSTLRSQELNSFSLLKLLFYPPLKFIHNYFFRLGFFDGLPGLAMAFMMSFHSLAVRVKQYENS